ncbi:S8 family serine peptidase [Leclercia sp.]|uniref:S8 family serine peptidase n=1 Tax=Leclercia sp. TaxID=1898428 RepID=UPI002FDC7F51
MKKSILSLLICAAVTCSAYAETAPHAELAQEGESYAAIVIKLKPGKPLLKATSTATTASPDKLTLSDPALVPTTMFHSDKLRSSASDDLAQLNARYGFDRYVRIELPENKSTDKTYINNLIAELEQNQNIELVYPETLPVSLDKIEMDEGQTRPLLKSTLQNTVGATAVPDFRQLQDYAKSPGEKRQGYYMGGVNRDSVNGYPGNDGEGVTIISMENYIWNTSHVNLPTPALTQGDSRYRTGEDHDTASVGIMAAKDMGAGIRGLSWKSRVGFAAWQYNNLYNMIPLLKAGDVVQMGMQTGGGEITGCTTNACYVPQENVQSYYDIIKALTDKGVYVIEAAGNGNVNLDHPAFNGKFDVHTRDSGAIIAGAFCAKSGKRASFSTYGSRVTSSSWGCSDVASTGYGDLYNSTNAQYTRSFSGTSSANPIVAGVVASLSGIAKANGITVTPVQMRQILQETGTPLADGDSAKVGTHPDMERAVARILALKQGDKTVPAPTAAAGADYTMVSPASGVSTYPLDGSKSLNVKSFNWSVSKGAGTFWLQEKLNGSLVNSVNSANAWAVIPANTEGEVTYTLTTTGEDGRTAQDSMTIKVSKPAAPATAVPAYNAKIAYPTKCTKVSYNGKIWMNQWYVNPGQETPGNGGTWGVWRQQGASGNSCK